MGEKIIPEKDIFTFHQKKYGKYYQTDNQDFLNLQLITYIGNKRKLFSFIEEGIKTVKKKFNKKKYIILDGFAGSGAVSRYLKRYSKILYVNDLEYYSYIINKCYLSNLSEIKVKQIREIISKLNTNKKRNDLGRGIIEKLYAPANDLDIQQGERVFYTNQNAKIIDNIRRMISDIELNKQYLYIAPLLVKASIHVNTSGVFKGFYKDKKTKIGKFGGRAKDCLRRIKGEIKLPIPIFSRYECKVNITKKNINNLIKEIDEIDIFYIDPPYNQHPYGSNYHILNTIALYKEPENISKTSGIPTDWNRSFYNKKEKADESFEDLIKNVNSKFIIVSYNKEGIININRMENILEKYGKVKRKERRYSVFRGSRNLRSRTKEVKEVLFVCEKK